MNSLGVETQWKSESGSEPCLHTQRGWVSGEWSVSLFLMTGKRHQARGKPCEDAGMVALLPDGKLRAALADGVSQGACGDLVSRILVNYLVDAEVKETAPDPLKDIQRVVSAAEMVVRNNLELYTNARGAATMAAIWVDENGNGGVSHAGDCRVYSWRNTTGQTVLTQITQDHTYHNLGERTPAGSHPNHPARMIGCHLEWQPPVQALQVPKGTGVIMCSDGVHSLLSNQRIAMVLEENRQMPDMAIVSERLALEAMAEGGQDDIAVLAIWRHR